MTETWSAELVRRINNADHDELDKINRELREAFVPASGGVAHWKDGDSEGWTYRI